MKILVISAGYLKKKDHFCCKNFVTTFTKIGLIINNKIKAFDMYKTGI